VCLLAAAGGAVQGRPRNHSAGATSATVGVLSTTADPAVLPARIADDVLVASQSAPNRLLLLAAVISVLAGLPAASRRGASATVPDSRPLRARGRTVALRAPPRLFA
jgi:hypothetical protein